MAFNIRIKPLVLFDLEDKIRYYEQENNGNGRRLYQTFLAGLSHLQHEVHNEKMPVYKTVKKHESTDTKCTLFYTVTGNLIMIIGLL